MGTYRSPDRNIDEGIQILTNILEETSAENFPIILMGDINVDILNPDSRTTKTNEALAYHDIVRLNLPATRVTPHSETSIDWICSNIDSTHLTTKVIHAGISDHTAQTCTLLTPQITQTLSTTIRRINNQNLAQLKILLQGEKWEEVIGAETAEEAFNLFNNQLGLYLNYACPRKKTRISKNHKTRQFADEEAKDLKNLYLKSLRKYEITGDYKDKELVAQQKKNYDLRLKALRRQSTLNYIDTAENKSKATWKVINQVRAKKEAANKELKLTIDGKTTTNAKEVANHMNSFFVSIADITLKKTQSNTLLTPQTYPIDMNLSNIRPTNKEEIKAEIDRLTSKNSAGLDEISSRMLKYCRDELVAPLMAIFNKSFEQGFFPSALKVSKVFPKFKSGDTLAASNYRPITLVSTFSKLCERIVLTRLLQHCLQNNLITDSQHGYIKGRSTTSAMIDMIEKIADSLEAREYTTGIFLDLSKAFDCLSHSLVIEKLEALGVTSSAKQWFKSYLEGRSQLVEVKCTEKGTSTTVLSDPLPIHRGVPQGSVLGPVLFILYTNDMPEYLRDICKTLMFADDTTLLLSEQSAEDLAVNSFIALNMAVQYCNGNDLVVNPSKTTQVAFGRRAEQTPCLPDIDPVNETKFLGITLDSNLSWTPHLDALSKKLNTSLYALRRIKTICDTKTTLTGYYALFESHVRYGLAVWGGTSATNLERILVLQKRAIRTIAGLQSGDSCRESFKTLKILTVVALYIQEVVMHIDGKNLPRGADRHAHNTRYASNYTLPNHHLTTFEKKPTYMGRRFYNHLPMTLRSKTGKKLKKELHKWLADRPFYTVQEFLQEQF